MTTRYEEVAVELRRLIQGGRWKPGDALPNEVSLAEGHKVSRTTIRSALGLLRAEGWIDTHPSKGSVVRRRNVVYRRYAPDLVRGGPVTDLHGVPLVGVRMDRYRVEVIPADDDIAAWLEVPMGTEVAVRRRLWLQDEEPTLLWDTFIARYLVKGSPLDGAAVVTNGTYAALEDLGYRPQIFTEHVRAREATQVERDLLRIGERVWVLEARRCTRNTHGLVVEGLMIVGGADRSVFSYEDIEIPEDIDLT